MLTSNHVCPVLVAHGVQAPWCFSLSRAMSATPLVVCCVCLLSCSRIVFNFAYLVPYSLQHCSLLGFVIIAVPYQLLQVSVCRCSGVIVRASVVVSVIVVVRAGVIVSVPVNVGIIVSVSVGVVVSISVTISLAASASPHHSKIVS